MKRIIFVLPLLLASCASIESTPIVTTSCIPPMELMHKEEPLPAITEATLTENQIIQYWLDDAARLNGLIIEKNAIVDHINKFCK